MYDIDTTDLPKTRRDAKAIDSIYYFKDTPCPRGHLAPRLTHDTRCIVCDREYHKAKYRKNKEYHRRKNAEWRAANPDYRKAYCANNPVKTYMIAFKNRYKEEVGQWTDEQWDQFAELVKEKLQLQKELGGTWRLTRTALSTDDVRPEQFEIVQPGGKKAK